MLRGYSIDHRNWITPLTGYNIKFNAPRECIKVHTRSRACEKYDVSGRHNGVSEEIEMAMSEMCGRKYWYRENVKGSKVGYKINELT